MLSAGVLAKEFIMDKFSSYGETSGFSVMGRDELELANGGVYSSAFYFLELSDIVIAFLKQTGIKITK
jgi:hypothetical protein